jgi:hypothetical protein
MRGHALRAEPRRPAPWHERRQARHLVGQALALLLLAAVIALIAQRAQRIDWPGVWSALRAYPPMTLLLALLLASGAHACYGAYDLLARHYLGYKVPARDVVAVGLVSYAFNLNLGSLVGGIGLRWRLYSRLGLGAGQTGRIFAFSLITNWTGYLLLAGLLLSSNTFALPAQIGRWSVPSLQWLGPVLLAVPLLYIAWCASGRRAALQWRNHRLEFPRGMAAAAQVALSSLHWILTGAVLWALLPEQLPFQQVLGTLLTAAVAGAMLHVPGGLGVIEAVFIAIFSAQVPEGRLIAALLAYRAAFYLVPLAGATVLYFVLEARARKRKRLSS